MAYGFFCIVVGTELVFAGPYWWVRVIGGLAALAGLFMMAGEEKTMKKSVVTLLQVCREIWRR